VKNFHKESSGILEALERPQAMSRPATTPNPGSAPGGIGPLRPRSAVGTRPGRIPHHPPARPAATGARCTQGAPKRKTGSILAPPFEMLPERSLLLERSVRATASNLDTLSRPITRSKSVHAVEFSKTVAPLLGGGSSSGARPGPNNTVPGRTDEYSAQHRCRLKDDAKAATRPSCGAVSLEPGRSPCVHVPDRRSR
jgi:hypothetical protein